MKPSSQINKHLVAFLITNHPEDAMRVQKTLTHAYPGISIEARSCTDCIDKPKPSLILIDTNCISGVQLEHLLDRASDTSAILIIKHFAEVRQFSQFLTSRRTIITHSDIEGMGLIQCIHHLLERQVLAEQLHKASRHLKELSIRDELTKLYNHRHLDEILDAEIKKANRYRRPLGLVIVAIKNFTTINEAFGHSEGDRILSRAADIIRREVREVDIPARYGDNEFAVILPESDEDGASIVAKRIQKALEEITATKPHNETPLITSCGIGAISERMQTKEDLIRAALAALIEAKRGNQNSICTAAEMVERRRDIHENRQIIDRLHERIATLTNESERSYLQSVMKTIGEAPTAKRHIMPHSERVAFFAQRLAEALNLSSAEVRTAYRAGLLHDSGKIAISADILSKPEKLSSTEQTLIQQHPIFATQIFGSTSMFTSELAAILHHHERMDGTGYPEGISGDSIPLHARILSIAEAWDTMISPQPYRAEPLSLDIALSEIKKGAGAQFDPDLAEKFTSLIQG